MVRADLVDYVEKAEARGLSVDQVKAILLKAGHSDEVVELAILETHKRARVGRAFGFHPAIFYFFILPVIVVVVVVGIANYAGSGDVDGGVVDMSETEYSMADLALFDEAVDSYEPSNCREISAFELRKRCFERMFPDTPFVYEVGMSNLEVTQMSVESLDYEMCQQISDDSDRGRCFGLVIKANEKSLLIEG
ncbi:MAG: hypothetical protein ABH828_01330 [archaeon]